MATDPDYRFELAVQLGQLDIALSIAETSDSEGKWRQLGELALSSGKLEVRGLTLRGCQDRCTMLLATAAWNAQVLVASKQGPRDVLTNLILDWKHWQEPLLFRHFWYWICQ